MENKLLINHFKIVAIGHKLCFKSTQPVALDLSKALIAHSDFIQDIKLYSGEYPVVKTTIYCRGMANIQNFLEISTVRKIFENEINS